MNLHTPERGAHESQSQYRTRQAASKLEVKRMTNPQVAARFAQHKNPARNAERAQMKAIGGRRQARKQMRQAAE